MTTKEHSEATAAAELERAEQDVRKVLERIEDGDKKIGPEDLEAAERRARFARARLDGVERREADEAERERLRRLEEIGERARVELAPGPLGELRAAALDALDAYVAACVAHNGALDEILAELPALEPLPSGWRVDQGSDGASLTAGGARHSRIIRPMVEVSGMARDVLRAHIPRGYIDLEAPY